MSKIKITSRDGTPRYIQKLPDGHYKISGESMYMRYGDNFIDYQGGPFININMDLSELNKSLSGKIIEIQKIIDDPKLNSYKLIIEQNG